MSRVNLDHFVSSNPFKFPIYTTPQRNTLTPVKGTVIFNSTTTDLEYWTGTKWETATG